MSKPTKKQGYHHGNLRRALMDAALELVAERGPHNFTLREAARRAGVSAGAPYKHFADKQALMVALALEGLALQRQMMDADMDAAPNIVERFRAQGIAVVKFAIAHPTHFRVMTTPEFVDPAKSEELRAALMEADATIQTILGAAQQDNVIWAGDPQIMSLAARALMYGLSRMFIDGLLSAEGIDVDQAEAVAHAVTEVLGHGLLPRPDEKTT